MVWSSKFWIYVGIIWRSCMIRVSDIYSGMDDDAFEGDDCVPSS